MKKTVLYQNVCNGAVIFTVMTFFGNTQSNIKLILCSISLFVFILAYQKLKEAKFEEENFANDIKNKIKTKVYQAFSNALNNLFYILSHELINTFKTYNNEFEYVKEIVNSDKTKIEKLDLINGKILLPTATQFKFIKNEEKEALLDLQLNQIKYIIENKETLYLILSNTENKQQSIFDIFCFMYKDYFKRDEMDNNICSSNRLEEFALLCFRFGIFGDKENGWKIHKIKELHVEKDQYDIFVVKYYNGNPTYFELSICHMHPQKLFFSNEHVEKTLMDNFESEQQKLGI